MWHEISALQHLHYFHLDILRTLIDAFWFACYFSLLIVTSNNGEYMKIKHSVNVVNSWAPPLIFSNIY